MAAFEPGIIDQAVGGLPPASKHAAALCAEGIRLLLAQSR
jgi:hypothetical protein